MGAVFAAVASVVFAVLFAAAAWHKLRNRMEFRAILADYEILPSFAVAPVAYLLPFAEASVATLWATQTALPIAACATLVLLTVYCCAVGVNLARGRAHISCGCGIGAEQPLSLGIILRNALLGLLGASGFLAVAHEWLWFDYAVVVLAALAVGCAMLATSTLLNNAMHMASWSEHD